jgi:hypothetical protein
MGSRYLCSHCGLNHDFRQICPQLQDHTDKQDAVDRAETQDIKRYGDMSRFAAAITEARKRADVMARLELQLETMHGDRTNLS